MKVVGLISGGKDSLFNLHICKYLGHDIVCVANLHPPPIQKEEEEDDDNDATTIAGEMDSFMYQTVGYEVVPVVAEALGLPLYKQAINRAPIETDELVYNDNECDDEVEDLYDLLLKVKRAHPEVNAVSCGAIFSDYQRLRVENVCQRLGLMVLAFMWRLPQDKLLNWMINTGIEARLVKVACMGLDEGHLGKTLSELQPYFNKLHNQFGFHVCGEGGEYETLTTDCPLYVNGRIELGDTRVIKHSSDVYYLQSSNPHIVPKDDTATAAAACTSLSIIDDISFYKEDYPIIELPDNDMVHGPLGLNTTHCYNNTPPPLPPSMSEGGGNGLAHLCKCGDGYIAITNSIDIISVPPPNSELLLYSDDDAVDSSSSSDKAREQCRYLLEYVNNTLIPSNEYTIIYVEVQVSDMVNLFGVVNDEYCKHFPRVNPPSRYCIQTDLPKGILVRFRIMAIPRVNSDNDDDYSVTTLHVQSISTWAMSCIGPYSQAKRFSNGMLMTAGVLGLIPHTMSLPNTWQYELWMAMRSLNNITHLMSSTNTLLAILFISARTPLVPAVELAGKYLNTDISNIIGIRLPVLPKGGNVEVSLINNNNNDGDDNNSVAELSIYSGESIDYMFNTTSPTSATTTNIHDNDDVPSMLYYDVTRYEECDIYNQLLQQQQQQGGGGSSLIDNCALTPVRELCIGNTRHSLILLGTKLRYTNSSS